jgi:hypothetical protein
MSVLPLMPRLSDLSSIAFAGANLNFYKMLKRSSSAEGAYDLESA